MRDTAKKKLQSKRKTLFKQKLRYRDKVPLKHKEFRFSEQFRKFFNTVLTFYIEREDNQYFKSQNRFQTTHPPILAVHSEVEKFRAPFRSPTT